MRGRAKQNLVLPRGGTFLTATGARVASHGTLEVTLQLVDVHGVVITVKAMFELLPVRRPIPSVNCLVDKEFAVVMGNEQGNTLGKDGRVIHVHKSNGVQKYERWPWRERPGQIRRQADLSTLAKDVVK